MVLMLCQLPPNNSGLHHCVPCRPGDDNNAIDSTSTAPGDPTSFSIFDMQLPVAAMNLLTVLLARSKSALDWMLQQPDR